VFCVLSNVQEDIATAPFKVASMHVLAVFQLITDKVIISDFRTVHTKCLIASHHSVVKMLETHLNQIGFHNGSFFGQICFFNIECHMLD